MAGIIGDAGSGADLAQVIAGVGATAGVTVRAGQVLWDSTTKTWLVLVGGIQQKAVWSATEPPYDGAACWVVYSTPVGGQSTAYVAGLVNTIPAAGPSGQVTIVPGGGTTCTVEVKGVPITATRLTHYIPAVGDEAALLWSADKCYAVGKVGTAAAGGGPGAGAPATAPPPAPNATGTGKFRSSDSGTWTAAVYNWNRYFGQNVYSGLRLCPTLHGPLVLWRRHGRGLADKTNIGAVRF